MDRRLLDEQALDAIEAGDSQAYEGAVIRGARPNPRSHENIGNLGNDLDSGYSRAAQAGNIRLMLDVLENTLAGTNMALSPMERQLLDAAQTGDVNQIAAALFGVRNPQIIDAARDIAAICGNTAFANAMFSAAKIVRENPANFNEPTMAEIQRRAILGHNAILKEQFEKKRDENQHTRTRRTYKTAA